MTVITFVSDLDMRGSGYQLIGTRLCHELGRDNKIYYFGLEYHREPHNFNFSAIPLPGLQFIKAMAENTKSEHQVIALDVPHQIRLLQEWGGSKIPYTAIFPVESEPLTPSWTAGLWNANHRFVISEFGLHACQEAGLEATWLPIGVPMGNDITTEWRPPASEERETMRSFFNLENKFVMLTVADNHERKNLSAALEIVADLVKKGIDVHYFLVTRLNFVGGWLLSDLVQTLDIASHVTLMDRNLPHKELWSLYALADCFLLPSKSEGLGIPILESFACKVPVVGTNTGSIHYLLDEGRGIPVDTAFRTIDPWGNSYRYFISKEDAVNKIMKLADMDTESKDLMVNKAFDYVSTFTIERTANTFKEALC